MAGVLVKVSVTKLIDFLRPYIPTHQVVSVHVFILDISVNLNSNLTFLITSFFLSRIRYTVFDFIRKTPS